MTSQALGDLREAAGQKRVQKSDLPRTRSSHASTNLHAINFIHVPKRSKYHAVRSVDADGLKWDSNAERKRWGELQFMLKAGLIRLLERQPRFPMEVKEGVFVGTYVADFRYKRVADSEWVIEDVKGVKTPLYKFKKKIVEALYAFKITEISA